MRKPKYSLHKKSGQARVIVHGKHIYLGKCNGWSLCEVLIMRLLLGCDAYFRGKVSVRPDRRTSERLSRLSTNCC